jgi:large subunit ribosomal protein L1
MPRHGKKYRAAHEQAPVTAVPPREAVALAKRLSYTKFDEAVEFHLNTTADPRQADQQVREVAALPHGTGKAVRVFVFAEGEGARAALEAGADYIASEELTAKIEAGWSDFDIAIATPDQMGKIARLGRFLGRKGLMPNPRTGTVVQTQDIRRAIETMKKGRAEIRMDKTANIHVRIGTRAFTEEQLADNLASVYATISRAKPSGVKGQFIKSATVSTTMGPGIKVDLDGLEELAKAG